VVNAFKYTKQLEEAGFSREQAEIQLQIMTEIVEGDLATKQDLQILGTALGRDSKTLESSLQQDIKTLETNLRHEMTSLDSNLRQDMKTLETNLKHEMTSLDSNLRQDMKSLEINIQ